MINPEILKKLQAEREALTPEERMVRALENIEDHLRDIKTSRVGDSHTLGHILKALSSR